MTNTTTTRRVLAVLAALVVVASPMAGVASASDAGSGHGSAASESLDAATAPQLNTAAMAPGDAVYRVNVGGNTIAASSGPDWTGNWEQYHSGSSSTYSTGNSITLDASVPSGTPTGVFQSEVYGDQQWAFSDSIQSGQEYEVRLYFAEIFHEDDGLRSFDVSVEGSQVLDDYDIHADVGHDVGVMQSYTVTPTDGQIDVALTTEVDNAKLSAVEIVESEPEPDTLGGPSSVDFGSVVVGDSASETVTVTNLGGDGDPDITIDDVSVSGDSAFSAGAASQTTLAPGESADIPVTFAPADAQSMSGTLEVTHSGSNSPLSVSLTGEGTSTAQVGFGKSQLQGFGQNSLTALEFGPDDRLYVAQQNGMVYALNVTRNGENSYSVESQEAIDAIQDIPNHDDFGNYVSGEDTRQVTGLTVGGTAAEPVVYVSSSDPTIDVGTDDDDTDTNSGAISRLTFDWSSDDTLNGVDHDVLVLGLPRSEENHATNGLDLSDDGDTLYVAQGGHTNQGAPSENFGHTPEYALSAAVLEVDLAQIQNDYGEKNLQNYDSSYPSVDFLYAIPTIQNDDGTDGDDLPFGGNDGVNQAKWVSDGPVQVYSSGYRNPYDLVLSEDDQLYVIDNGPNGGWGGQPINEGPSGVCTNAPNDPGGGSGDQLHLATEGSYGGHPAPIRGNPTGADIYDANGNVIFDINSSNSPVPASEVDPVECDYQDPSEDNSIGDEFGWTGGMDEYTASNFGGAMQGDLLVVVGSSSVERVQLNAGGDGVTDQEGNFFSDVSALGIAAQGDDGPFPGTVWTARGDVTVFEPNDYESAPGGECTGADDSSLDEDGDGYDNADEIDAGTDPCSAASTPADFDDDGTSNLNDPDDDNDGQPDTSDPFAVDPEDGTTTTLPIQMEFTETQLFGEDGQGWTGLMTNGQDDYQDLYDPGQMTVGGAAQVLTVENVPQGDAHQNTNTQQFAFQRGFDASQPFTVETTVNGLPSDAESFQSQGVFIGTGDQDNYAKLTVTGFSSGSGSGVQFATEDGGSFSDVANPPAPTAGNTTTLSMTVYPSNGTVEAYYAMQGGSQQFVGETTVPTSWFDATDGTGTAVGVISTSNGASTTFDATWQYLHVEYVTPPANQPPVADAGADQTVDAGAEVTLDASNSTDPDGDDSALGYTWTQTAGTPTGLLDMSDSAQVSFTAPDVSTETTYTFQVSVSDGEDSDTDTVDVTVQPTDDGDLSIAEAVAMGGENDSLIEDPEIQQSINWWSTDSEVPNTGGETINNSQIQSLVNLWATDAQVGDGDGGDDATGSALVEITPDSGVEATTYGGGTYQVTNTGEKNISSVSFDLSSAALPDMVFDPQGTAGDPTGEGLNIVDDGGTGITTAEGGSEAFSQPHNGQNADDGYDVMTVEFGDFQNGETATFWADNDPTSIKGATVGSQEAGPVSGLELARSTITVTYEDGTTQTTQLMGDGSAGGATAVVTGDEAAAPSIGVDAVSLNGSVLDGYHSAATVSQASQTVTVTGQPGETVTLVRVEGELTLQNVAQPYNDIEDYEANDAEDVEYYTATLDANGEATVPVTLTNTTADGDDNAGYNYFVAAHGEPTGDMGLASNVVVLEYDESATDPAEPGEVVFAVNAGGSEYTAADGTVFQADTNFDNGTTYSVSEPIDGTQDDPLYQTERYGDFSYDVPVENGEYEVTLKFAEIYQGVGNEPVDSSGPSDGTQENDRVFNASVEGEQVLSNYDIFAEVGPLTATDHTFTANVSDGTLNVEFSTVYDNAKVSAIEVAAVNDSSGGGNTAPTLDAIANQTVTEGDSTTVPVSADDADGDTVSLSVSGPDFVGLSNGQLSIAPQSGDAGTYTVEVTADDGNGGTATESFQLTVEAPSTGGDLVYAVNAGGSNYTATDGTTYVADTEFGGSFSNSQGTTSVGVDIGNTDDDPLYQTERYGDPLSYSMPVENGEYEVTLKFAEIYHGVDGGNPSGGVGDRVFNASVEGEQVLSNYDIYAEVGASNATDETATVEVTDGELNIELDASADFSKLSAFTVTQVDGGDATASADFTVNENGGIDASTFGSGSFEMTNTGDVQISSVTYDLSSAAFPDVVFDPQGTAGDSSGKDFTPDSGESAVDPSGSFAAPHNGQNGDDGYDQLAVDFGDFQSGESFAFSTDIDPTSIKNAQGTGAAGSVSGLELAGATVTVEYADGTTQTTSLFGDGSSGGSQAAAKDGVAGAPTLGAQDVSLDSSALDARHSAATVADAQQTVTVSGPSGATVELLHVEGQLELANQANGYDLEDYEANTAADVAYHTVQLDSNGEATVDVTLTNTSSSGVEGGFNYFVAAVQDGSGDTGETSNAVVLKYDQSSGSTSPQVLHRVNAGEDTTVSATDDGPDWTGVADTSSPYLASVAPSSAGNYCGGDDITADSTVPSSTPDAVWDCERYGNSTWEFSVDSGEEVEVRLYLGNSFSGASEPGDRQFNVSVEGTQVLTQYDPVADVGHATGTMKNFTATDDGDGTITVVFEKGAVENPEVRAIEIVESGDSSQ